MVSDQNKLILMKDSLNPLWVFIKTTYTPIKHFHNYQNLQALILKNRLFLTILLSSLIKMINDFSSKINISNSPTTTIIAALMSVWKSGASADTSHWYSPVNVRSTSVSTTLFWSEAATCNGQFFGTICSVL